MDTRIIHLDPEDDIISICDRLDWAGAQRVLLILPQDGSLLQDGLDLVRLRRHADRRRQEIGLVTTHIEMRRQATALGIPTFLTVAGAEKGRRGWWRGRRRRERVGLPTVGGSGVAQLRPEILDEEDRREMARRLQAPLSWRRWVFRYFAILLFFMTLALLVVSFAYAVPSATLTLQPEVRTIQATRLVLADPALAAADYALGAVPARLLQVGNRWQAEVETTGTVAVPNASARGQVLFANVLDQEVTIPAGTRVSTSEGSNLVFQTVVEATVAGVAGSTAEVDVIAIEPGPQGNVAENLINRVEGPLATQLEVRNLEPMSGGAVREVAAVTEVDRTRLRAQVLQYLQALATSEMEAQLTEREFLAQESLRVANIEGETYSHFPGEQTDELTLEMQAVLQGTVVNISEATGLLVEALTAELPSGYTLVPEGLVMRVEEVVGVDEAGRVTFVMVAEGLVAAELELAGPVAAITGQPPQLATAYLYEQLPLRATPAVHIWPTWFNRIPYLPARIQTEVDTGS